jgi:hypothetical protein
MLVEIDGVFVSIDEDMLNKQRVQFFFECFVVYFGAAGDQLFTEVKLKFTFKDYSEGEMEAFWKVISTLSQSDKEMAAFVVAVKKTWSQVESLANDEFTRCLTPSE